MKIKPHLSADFYKPAHIDQYSKKTSLIQSNFTARSARLFPHFADEDQRILFGGLQGPLAWFFRDLWNDRFFNRPKDVVVGEYKRMMDTAIGKDKVNINGISELHDLGYLPLEVRALPEGSLVPVRVPVYTVHNTHPDFYWLVNFLESVISAETWKTVTTATTVFQLNKLCRAFAQKTCDNFDHLPYQLHMFAFRGEAGVHDAAQSEFGHLMNSMGTDTIPSICYAEDYYGMEGQFVAGSIPASEHSVATTNIGFIIEDLKVEFPEATQDELRYKAEVIFLRKYITEIYPDGFVSYVADSYDYWAIVTKALPELYEEIIAREGRLVIRPDSGIPEHIIAGYRTITLAGAKAIIWNDYKTGVVGHKDSLEENLKDVEEISKVSDLRRFDFDRVSGTGAELIEHDGVYYDAKTGKESDLKIHEIKGTIQCLWEIFGGHVNSKGYKVLDTHIGLIYGDSIHTARAKEIFKRLDAKGFASSNVVFGVGSYSTQFVTRDSLGFAMKATGAVIGGHEILVTKDPKTDSKKKSAKGFLKVVKGANGNFELVDGLSFEQSQAADNELRVVWRDSKFVVEETLTTIRERVQSHFQ